jgi:hypothetical protein
MHFRNPLMRQGDRIEILSYNGIDRVTISGPGAGIEGIWLAEHSTGLFDTPFKTNWTKGMFGSVFQSWVPQRRDLVFTVHIMSPDGSGQDLEHDPDLWHLVYSKWKSMWSIDQESTIIYTSVDGERRLGARLLQASKSFSSQSFEGMDPHIMPYGSVMMTVACEFPYYVGGTVTFTWEDTGLTGGASAWFTLPYYNPSTVMIWPWWTLSDQVQWVLPDYSFGWEEYGRGVQDLGKTVAFTPFIAGEICTCYSEPDLEPIIAANGAPVLNRMAGKALEYPIQPGMGSVDEGCTVRAVNCTNPNGAYAELNLDRWYNEPFSTPLIAAP